MKHLDFAFIAMVIGGFTVQVLLARYVPYSYRQNVRSACSYIFGDSNLY